jgi:hypothetical protein
MAHPQHDHDVGVVDERTRAIERNVTIWFYPAEPQGKEPA